jgi:hypothetical protein
MVNKPVVKRGGAIRAKLMADWFDGLEREKDVHFLAEDCVFGAA